MRLSRQPDRSLEFSRLSTWEMKTLRSVPALADPSGMPEAERRLFPDPAPAEEAGAEQLEDWREFTIPELEHLFRSSIDYFQDDLAQGTLEIGPAMGDDKDDDEEEDEKEDFEEDADEPDEPDNAAEDEAEAADKNSGGVIDAAAADEDSAKSEADEEEDGESSSGPETVETWTVRVPPEHIDHWFRAINQARLVMSMRFGIDSERFPGLAELMARGTLERYLEYEMLTFISGWLVNWIMDEPAAE